ncbi:MAG: T9SS type A sorting domain-containing protein [Candidatus Aegiribacteria sp.]|nr:T9SS type A sorting domain-containing protein [Candidatus Aegiribacteria sp.]MBD3295169.1 T9SS type A sorting domain-containing protein [Candidatus Fermentibacteria bacterium]
MVIGSAERGSGFSLSRLEKGGRMKITIIALLITGLLAGAVYAGITDDGVFEATLDNANALEGQDALYSSGPVPDYGAVDCSTLANPNEPPATREYAPAVASIVEEPALEATPVSLPGQDWDDDIEVWGGRAGTGQDFDIDENTGDLYACFDTDNTTNDTLYVFRSTDGGLTWTMFGVGTNSVGEISNPKVRIVQDGSGNSQVVVMGIWDGTSYDNDLYTRWWTTGGGGGTWQLIESQVQWADMDADVGSGGYAYAVYVPDGTFDINTATNDVTGSGWDVNTNFVDNTEIVPFPAIAAGAGGVVGVVYVDDRLSDLEVRAKMSTNYGASWLNSVEVSSLGGTPEHPDIAFDRSTPATGWIVTESISTGDDWLGYYLTTDTGVNWSFEDNFDPGDDDNLPSIRARKVTGSVTLAFNSDPGDNTMFTWASQGDPTNFSTPEAINDFAATGFWPPCAGWNGQYSAVLYANWDQNYRIMFDWFGNTGIDDGAQGLVSLSSAPNPFSAVTNISFQLGQPGPVDITIYDVTGHAVRKLVDGQSFGTGTSSVQWNGRTTSGEMATPGVYFCRLTASGIDETQRMLMVR